MRLGQRPIGRMQRITAVAIGLSALSGVAIAEDIGVFVSSQTMNGNIGGLTGADSICQNLGAAAFPGSGPWVAWLSDSTTNARDRIPIPGANGVYVRPTQPGIVIANNLADLTDGSLSAAILLDETSAAPPINPSTGRATAWTGTTPSGTVAASHCSNWTTSGPSNTGLGGASELSDGNWTLQVTAECNLELRLYCFGAIADPEHPTTGQIISPEYPNFRFWVRISDVRLGKEVVDCLSETVCVAGAIPTRAEILIRIVGPKANGYLWPNIVKFNTTKTEVWIQQISTGRTKYYSLPALAQDSTTLPGLVDRTGFLP